MNSFSFFIKKAIEETKKNPLTGWYFIQGHILWWLHGNAIMKWNKKRMECLNCYEEGVCNRCGCSFDKIALTNKCKNYVES
jgi:hypothetical protein